MKRSRCIYLISFVLFLLVSMACLISAPVSVSEPKAAVAPIKIGSDLTTINICQAVPQEDIEAVMGRKLVRAPQRFEYYDAQGTSGCTYDSGKDASGSANFGYVVMTPVEVYNTQPLYKKADVKSLGEEAYFNNGADARQLWVKVNEKVAFVVAFGDQPKEDGAMAIAKLFLAAIVSP